MTGNGGMYAVENPIPHFNPYDICQLVETKAYVLIREVNLNLSQPGDDSQWSYTIESIDGLTDKVAWYHHSELRYVNNVFELISKMSVGTRSSSFFRLSLERRK